MGKLYFFIGKMGAGKSYYASLLAEQTSGILISADEWLAQLFPGEINEFSDFIVRHRRLVGTLDAHIVQLLKAGLTVILDFPANTVRQRALYKDLAQRANAQHTAVYMQASRSTCLQHIAQRRQAHPERAQFDNEAVFDQLDPYFEAPQISEELELQTIESDTEVQWL